MIAKQGTPPRRKRTNMPNVPKSPQAIPGLATDTKRQLPSQQEGEITPRNEVGSRSPVIPEATYDKPPETPVPKAQQVYMGDNLSN